MKLTLNDVYYRYKSNLPYVLNGVSGEFESGNLYAVTGESGCGKTTLMSIIGNLDRPEKGTISIDGADIKTINEDTYRSKYVAMIFQSYNLLYNYTAVDNIILMLNISGYKGDCKERAGELLNEVGITPEKQRRVVTELSGGEQQRVAIARAVASESKIILADEPTGSLDSKNSENIMEIFSEIRGRYNTCIIIVTHSAEIASKCDKVMRMSEGKLSYSETCK